MRQSIAKYLPNDTVIHKMDPRIKIIINIIFIIMIFTAQHFILQAIFLIPILVAFFMAKIRVIKLLTLAKPLIFLGIFLFLINIIILEPDDYYFKWWAITISWDAIKITCLIIVRVYLMIIITTILTTSTKPLDLTRGLEDLMSPLKIIKFPAHIIAMIISIALRFIPTLFEEAQRIMKAQASRGVDFKHGGFKNKIKSTITLIIPLFVSAFSKAEDLGNAMETRGYDPYATRTRYRKYTIKWFDILALFIVLSIFVLSILIQWTNLIHFPGWWI